MQLSWNSYRNTIIHIWCPWLWQPLIARQPKRSLIAFWRSTHVCGVRDRNVSPSFMNPMLLGSIPCIPLLSDLTSLTMGSHSNWITNAFLGAEQIIDSGEKFYCLHGQTKWLVFWNLKRLFYSHIKWRELWKPMKAIIWWPCWRNNVAVFFFPFSVHGT